MVDELPRAHLAMRRVARPGEPPADLEGDRPEALGLRAALDGEIVRTCPQLNRGDGERVEPPVGDGGDELGAPVAVLVAEYPYVFSGTAWLPPGSVEGDVVRHTLRGVNIAASPEYRSIEVVLRLYELPNHRFVRHGAHLYAERALPRWGPGLLQYLRSIFSPSTRSPTCIRRSWCARCSWRAPSPPSHPLAHVGKPSNGS